MDTVADKIISIFDFLIAHNGLSSKKREIERIREILFTDFNNEWKKKNQKFDFSFSFKDRGADSMRFSYNNFGEKKGFYDKTLAIFDLFDDAYNKGTVKRILDALDSRNAVFQTTIGFEWGRGDALPRFKIYFEEIHQKLSPSERMELVEKIAGILDFDRTQLIIKADDVIGAICVDFLPQKKTNLKVYFMSHAIDFSYIKEVFCGRDDAGDAIREFCDIFSLEKLCFYYMARRFGGGGMQSVKVYKIYEVASIRDFSRSYKEIFHFLKYSPMKNDVRKFRELLAFSLKKKILFYPVISSIDLPLGGSMKYDLYVSVLD